MGENYFKNLLIPTIIITVMVFSSISFSSQAKAQSINGYISGMAPAVASLPLCKDEIDFGGVKGLFTNNYKNTLNEAKFNVQEYDGTLDNTANDIANKVDSVNVNLPDNVNQDIADTKQNTEEIKASTNSINKNDTCLKSIGRMVIKMIVQKMTLATVDWINNGFDGKPAFIQNPGTFFNDIAKNEILQFGAEINNPELFPFGRDFMKNQALAYKSKFADNATYSLNKLIQNTNPEYSDVSFNEDFSQGGWDAWTYLTQVPANNPLGFQIIASNELSKRLAGTEQSDAQNLRDSLQQSTGFLGDMRCKNPKGITKEAEKEALANGKKSPCTGGWEYVTPGAMVAKAATDSIKYPENNLLKAEDLNDAVASIIDALLNRFSSDIMSKGYKNLSTDAGGSYTYNENYSSDFGINHTVSDFSSFTIEASSWLQQNPNFNIRTDLNQALIDEQRTYIEKITEQNKELPELIKVIRQLDYCIPGPHPGWEDDSMNRLNETLAKVPSYDGDVDNSVVGTAASVSAKLGKIFPAFGTFSTVYNFYNNLFGDTNGSGQQKYYAAIINGFTGLQPTANGKTGSMQQVVNVVNTVFQRYADIIHQIYDQNPNMPLVTAEAKNEFFKIPGYEKIISDNTKKINTLKSITTRLSSIKESIDALNSQLANGTISQTEYENSIKTFTNSFGRLSADMVSGDNISNVDNILKQIKDKKVYIYNDLLKGPGGCEQDLSIGQSVGLPWQFFVSQRMTYPFPLLYDYNKLKSNELIPDPWGSGYKNRMRNLANVNDPKVGPGFLSYTIFGRGRDVSGAFAPLDTKWGTALHSSQFPYITPPESNHPGRINMYLDPDLNPTQGFMPGHDDVERIVDISENKTYVSVGKNDCSNNANCSGVFESMLGIY